MSDLNSVNRDELKVLIEEGLIDWLQQAKADLESQGVDFSDGVDGEEIGKILSYGGEKLRDTFDDILSRFGGDELGSEEAIETAAEEIEDTGLDSETTRRRAADAEIERVRENFKYAILKGTKDYSSLDENERELYDIFFGKDRRPLREDRFSAQPLETLEDVFRLGWNIVEEVFDGSVDFIKDFSEAVFEDCMEWEEYDESFGPFTLDYGEGGDFGLGGGGWNPLNWVPEVGVINLGPKDIDYVCMPEQFFKLLVKHLKNSAKQIAAETIFTTLDVFGINEPYPQWAERGIVKMQDMGLIHSPSALEKLPDQFKGMIGRGLRKAGDTFGAIQDRGIEGLRVDEQHRQKNANISFREFEKIIEKDRINDRETR